MYNQPTPNWPSPPSGAPSAPLRDSTQPPEPLPAPWAGGRASYAPPSPGGTAPPAFKPARRARTRGSGRAVMLALVGLLLGVLVGVGGTSAVLLTSRPKTSTPPPAVTAQPAAIYSVVGIGAGILAAVAPTNQPLTIRATASTTITREGLSAKFRDLTIGARIAADGKLTANGSLQASSIEILDPTLTGQVTRLLGTGFILTLPSKVTVTVAFAQTLRIIKPSSQQLFPHQALKAGQTVSVYGTPVVTGGFQAVIVEIRS